MIIIKKEIEIIIEIIHRLIMEIEFPNPLSY